MVSILRFFFKSIPTLFLSFILAVAVWMMAVTDADPIEEKVYPRPVPVEIIGQDANLILTSNVPSQVFITLNAPSSIWDRLSAEQKLTRAVLDLTDLDRGTHVVQIMVQVAIQPVEVVSYSPRSVELTLESYAREDFDIRVIQRGEPAIGFQAEPPILGQKTVTVSGPEQLIDRVNEVRTILDINQAETEINRTLTLQAVSTNDTVISGVSLDPEQITVEQKITQLGGYRNLAIKVVVNGQVSHGYRLTNISSFPAAVTIFSSDLGLVDELPGYVETEVLDVTGAKDDLDVHLFLDLPPSVSVVGEATVQVQVAVAAIESSLALDDKQVEAVGVAEGLFAKLAPETVVVILSGPLPILEQLGADDVLVYVDISDEVEPGTYQRVVNVEVTEPDLRVDTILPETIEVTLEDGDDIGKDISENEDDLTPSNDQDQEDDSEGDKVETGKSREGENNGGTVDPDDQPQPTPTNIPDDQVGDP